MAVLAAAAAALVFFVLRSPQKRSEPPVQSPPPTTMTLTSPAFVHNGAIMKKYTCDGHDINPELHIAGVPDGAAVLALLVNDPDAPHGTFTHWTVWNISPATTVIKEKSKPAGSVEGKNSAGRLGYLGPCPPPGAPHHYIFTLYALRAKLSLPEDATPDVAGPEIEKNAAAKAELVGLYER